MLRVRTCRPPRQADVLRSQCAACVRSQATDDYAVANRLRPGQRNPCPDAQGEYSSKLPRSEPRRRCRLRFTRADDYAVRRASALPSGLRSRMTAGQPHFGLPKLPI